MVIVVSDYALERLVECSGCSGLSKKAAMRMAEKAYTEGVTHSETKGNLNRWVTKLYFANRLANIRLYGDKAFVFSNTILINVLQIPQNLTKNIKSLITQRNNSQEGCRN